MLCNADHSSDWDDKAYTQNRVALFPARMHPIHLGHVNCLANLAERFAEVRVLLYDFAGRSDCPYPQSLRLEWLEKVKTARNFCNLEVVTICETIVMPSIEAQREKFAELSSARPYTMVTGNTQSIGKLKSWNEFPFINLGSVTLPNLVEAAAEITHSIESNARKIRELLRNGKPIPKNWLPLELENEIRNTSIVL